MSKSRPTLKDIAKLANCSTAVVSKVVNNARGNTLVSKEMRQRVRAAAREVGYRPNFASRSLVRQSTETIGIYVPPAHGAGLGLPYEGAVITGVERACREHAYDLLAINLGGEADHDTCGEKFAEGRIDGLVLLHLAEATDWIGDLLTHNRNIVAVNYYGKTEGLKTINFDDRKAVRLAVEHLAGLGHRRIGWVSDRYTDLGPGARLRQEGYREAMQVAGLPVDARFVWDFEGGDDADDPSPARSATDAVAHFLAMPEEQRPTAIVCYNDSTAGAAVAELDRRGMPAPKCLSIVGIDDSAICEYTRPQLTSVRQPLEMMGYQAAAHVIEASRDSQPPQIASNGPAHPLTEPRLVVRESTCPCSAS